ncbi:MAG TPA: hypothetical protein VMA34_10700 [Terracidiphilus sp.]|nr:hypothetical protein [Terracidiphilus sp.]
MPTSPDSPADAAPAVRGALPGGVRLLGRTGGGRLSRGDWIVLCGFVLLTAWTALHHEPWADEAQAWLLARDSSLAGLLLDRLHYEGTPGLWYVLLWGLHRAGLPYPSMQTLALAANAAAVYLLLRFSPFAAPIRWALPLSVALAYQLPIVARSYSLIPPLVFLLCIAIERQRPIAVGLLAGLLANLSLISLCMALGFFLLVLLPGDDGRPRPAVKARVLGGSIFAVLLLAAVYTAIPGPDVNVGRAQALAAKPRLRHLLAVLTHEPVEDRAALSTSALPRDSTDTAASPAPGLAPFNAKRRPILPVGGALTLAAVHFASLAFFPVSSINLLALLFYAALLVWLAQQRRLRASLPLAAVLIGAKALPFNEHHACVIWIAIVAVLWLGWKQPSNERAARAGLALASVLLLVLAEQLCWTGFACWYDCNHPFSGSRSAARWLQPRVGRESIVGFNYHSIAVQLYTAQRIYSNQKTAYWPWSIANDSDARIAATLAQRPEVVVDGEGYNGNVSWRNQILQEKPAGVRNDADGVAAYLLAHGYEATHRFCGSQPSQLGFSEMTCQVIYQPAGAQH